MWFRRRRRAEVVLADEHDDEGVRIIRRDEAEVVAVPALRMERYVVALAVHNHQLEDRLTHLEHLLAAQADDVLDLPTHEDLLDVRLHSSRVASDLGRLALELRTEVAEIKEEADRVAHRRLPLDLTGVDPATLDPEALVLVAEGLLELADRLDQDRRRRDDRAAG
jgi:hypothetical protein